MSQYSCTFCGIVSFTRAQTSTKTSTQDSAILNRDPVDFSRSKYLIHKSFFRGNTLSSAFTIASIRFMCAGDRVDSA